MIMGCIKRPRRIATDSRVSLLRDAKLKTINDEKIKIEEEYRSKLIVAAVFTSSAEHGMLDMQTLRQHAQDVRSQAFPLGREMEERLGAIESGYGGQHKPNCYRTQYLFDDIQRLRYVYDVLFQLHGEKDPEDIFPWLVSPEERQRLELKTLAEIFSKSSLCYNPRLQEGFDMRLRKVQLRDFLGGEANSIME